MRILVVEDNEVNRELVLHMLDGLGLQVTAAADGFEALALAATASFDLVLMDMQMPGMDGLQTTRALRALPGWADTPIVALTANAFDEDRRTCLAAGMTEFLAKPISAEALFNQLLRWLPAPPAA